MEILITIFLHRLWTKIRADELVKNQNRECNEPCYYNRTIIYLNMKTKFTSDVWILWCLAFGVSIKRKNGSFIKATEKLLFLEISCREIIFFWINGKRYCTRHFGYFKPLEKQE